MKANLDGHVRATQSQHKGCQPIYLIEGLGAFLRKNKNAKNREYVAAARAVNAHPDSDDDLPSSTQRQRTRKSKSTSAPDLSFFTQDIVDALFLHLQLTHPTLLIHHTPTPAQSAHWIRLFTESLSLRPAKLQQYRLNDMHAGFCMESGQVRTGDNREDIFVRMLQELPRVTASMAWGIHEAGYPGVRELITGFKRTEEREGKAEAKLMLEDVKKAVNRDGGVSERRLGPVVSRRIYKLFLGTNPGVTDV
jgi:crossover junction endonuclease EME1